MSEKPVPGALALMPSLIFGSRWLQVPLYLGLIVAQFVYVILFLKELWHLVGARCDLQRAGDHADRARPDRRGDDLQPADHGDRRRLRDLRLAARAASHPDQPEWLSHVNASVLKIKLAMAIIGISSIHLLRTFIDAGNLGGRNAPFTEAGIMWQAIIHTVFILSAIGIAFVDRMSQAPGGKLQH